MLALSDAIDSDPRSNSSPRSVTTPLAPNRLTFPTDHQDPNLATRSDDGPVTHSDQSRPRGFKRPGSSTFNESVRHAQSQLLWPHYFKGSMHMYPHDLLNSDSRRYSLTNRRLLRTDWNTRIRLVGWKPRHLVQLRSSKPRSRTREPWLLLPHLSI